VAELAKELEITENGVRAHLNTLERDGLVHQAGVRPGTRKPFHSFELTQEGEELFPKAYGAMLAQMLQVLYERMPEPQLIEAFEETGRRLGAKLAPGHDRLAFENRVKMAFDAFTEIGAVADISETPDSMVVQGRSCPLAEAVAVEPHACSVAHSLFSSITGSKVVERCQRGARPHCCFEISKNGKP
jgi:predicted ArsR family transcriptional regulator